MKPHFWLSALAFTMLAPLSGAFAQDIEATASQAERGEIFGVVERAGAAFAAGDLAAMGGLFTSDLTIIDEMAPYTWSGSAAFETWAGALAAHEARTGRSDSAFAIGALRELRRTDTHAYAVADATYDFTQGGRRYRETGINTWTLVKTSAGWKISGWTWTLTGTAPR